MVYDLTPNDGHKSFYGRAKVIEAGENKLLRSYETIVAYLDKTKKLHRTWEGWSATTARHVDAFAGRGIRKAEWEKMPVEPVPNY